MSAGPVVVGVIGIGRIGRQHTQNILSRIPAIRVKWLCDVALDSNAPMRAWADSQARALGPLHRTTTDYRDVLADPEVEAVIIACSTNLHARFSLEALRAGKHVFCEKPVSRFANEIREVIAEVEKSQGRLKYQVGFNRRFDRNFARARAAVRSGEVGEPHLLRVTSRDPTYVADYLRRAAGEGGLMSDMTIHDFDMLNFLVGPERARVTQVFAMGSALIVPDVGELGDVDTAVVTLRLESGAIATIDNSREAVYGYDQRVEVFGSSGCVQVENETASTCRLMTKGADGGRREQRDPLPWWFTERYAEAFVQELVEWAACVRAGPEVQPPVTCLDQLRATLLADAARESLQTGKPVVPQPI